MMNNSKIEKLDEEFTNFMHKVNEVSNIIGKMTSDNKEMQKIADIEAQQFLGDKRHINENDVLKTKTNRTIINRNAFKDKDNSAMSQEVFMAEVSRDAEERYRNKCIRRERMETLKKQANLAFKRGEYEKSLSLYNKAIDLIKDCSFLYFNRALCYINLKIYENSIEDINKGLKINENSLKGWLLLAKSCFLNGDLKGFEKAVEEAKNRNKDKEEFILDYVQKLQDEN